MKHTPSQSTAAERLITNEAGFSIIEALLASALFSLFVTAMVGAYIYGKQSTSGAGNRARAALLAEEGLEALRNIRDHDYANLADGTRGLTSSTNQWALSGSADMSDIFTRQLTIATIDSNRKAVTATISWPAGFGTTTIALSTVLANWRASSGGGQNRAGWAIPAETSILDFSGAADGIKVAATDNYAYVVRNDGTPDFLVVDITGTPFVAASLSLTGTPTNIFVADAVAYVSNQDDSQELQLIDITTPTAPSVIATFDALGTANANGVFVSGTTAYLVRDSSANDELIAINVSAPLLPVLAGSLDLSANGYELWLSAGRAYVASGDNTRELQVVDVNNPLSMSITGALNLTGNTDAITIAGFATTTLIGQGAQFAIVNITDPAAPTLTTTFNTGQTVRDIAVFADNTLAFLAGDAGSSEFAVIDISTQSTPASWGSINLADSLNGVAYNSARDRAYAVGIDDAAEFHVFAPQ